MKEIEEAVKAILDGEPVNEVVGTLSEKVLPRASATSRKERARYFRSRNDMVHGGKLFGQFRGDYRKRLKRYVAGDDSALKP
ncbi:MAG: hypothetical protein ACXABY_05925 [Candidatus Thorarchaeota archaeon]|jgi:hypothetical protein